MFRKRVYFHYIYALWEEVSVGYGVARAMISCSNEHQTHYILQDVRFSRFCICRFISDDAMVKGSDCILSVKVVTQPAMCFEACY